MGEEILIGVFWIVAISQKEFEKMEQSQEVKSMDGTLDERSKDKLQQHTAV